MVKREKIFAGRTVLLIGAGCDLGQVLAAGYASAGARVIAMDDDEARLLNRARQMPTQINTLKLNCLSDLQRNHFGSIWEDEPLDVLVHIQAVRHMDRPGEAITSVVEMTQMLARALKRGRGRVLILYPAIRAADPLHKQAFAPGWARLAPLLDGVFAADGITVNGVQLTPQVSTMDIAGPEATRIADAALMLTAPEPGRIGGSVLQLDAQSD